MDIKILRDPAFHIIIDDFLPLAENKAILEHIISLKEHYITSALGEAEEVNKNYRSNLNLHIDQVFAADENAEPDEVIKHRAKSPLLKMIDGFMQHEKILSMLDSAPAPFHYLRECNYWSTQVSRYGDKDHYHWHYDRIPWDDTRLISFVYYVHTSPRKFSGGELSLTDGLLWGEDITGNSRETSIEPQNNRLVLFDSRTLHTVKKTTAPEEFKDGRFSINVWIGRYND
jgi:Rps23 Pro-64 3,4-dihydroxylase Tpa1-like proline 4-hydroxylase